MQPGSGAIDGASHLRIGTCEISLKTIIAYGDIDTDIHRILAEAVIVHPVLGKIAALGQFGQFSAGQLLTVVKHGLHANRKSFQAVFVADLNHTPFRTAQGCHPGIQITQRSVGCAHIGRDQIDE